MRFIRKDKIRFLKVVKSELTNLGYEVDYRRFDRLCDAIMNLLVTEAKR